MTTGSCTSLSRSLTRRRVVALLSGGPLAVAFRAPALAASSPSLQDRLEAALAAIPLGHPTSRLDLVGLIAQASGFDTRLRAIVRLTWPPGTRQREFVTRASDEDQALLWLEVEIRAYFTALQ